MDLLKLSTTAFLEAKYSAYPVPVNLPRRYRHSGLGPVISLSLANDARPE